MAITIAYNVGVKTPCGWRTVRVQAIANKASEKMATVESVTLIGGEPPSYVNSVTGAKRQAFCGLALAKRETGARKRLSSCEIVG